MSIPPNAINWPNYATWPYKVCSDCGLIIGMSKPNAMRQIKVVEINLQTCPSCNGSNLVDY